MPTQLGTPRFKANAVEGAQQFGVTDSVPAARRCADSQYFWRMRGDLAQEVTKPLLYH
jgi:hypothetical protein